MKALLLSTERSGTHAAAAVLMKKYGRVSWVVAKKLDDMDNRAVEVLVAHCYRDGLLPLADAIVDLFASSVLPIYAPDRDPVLSMISALENGWPFTAMDYADSWLRLRSLDPIWVELPEVVINPTPQAKHGELRRLYEASEWDVLDEKTDGAVGALRG